MQRKQTSIVWKGRDDYHSLENCIVTTTHEGAEVNSVIVGTYGGKIYRIAYFIKTSPDWQTTFIELKITTGGSIVVHRYESDGKGNWTTNGVPVKAWEGCIDVDIALSPFTNTLPINRIKLSTGEVQLIRVVYFDILEGAVKPLMQQYTRISDSEYHYQNVPNDFEAVIKVDDEGLAIDYPGLFERKQQETFKNEGLECK